MNIHELKCHVEYFKSLKDGTKTAEIRYNDRDFQKSDILKIQAYHHLERCFDSTQDPIYFEVTHILSGKPYLPDNYVMLSLKSIAQPQRSPNE